ncbi:unnamed protein product [Strongylus vulgaris]|uniref:Uncharacterized protein n=1 Tax=Strongylus vulgaris TaxID=40348 RepID=A0A3P7LXE8_STRVU|nr:unnamed protein product [Strongylus vulgaris]
MVTHVCSWMGRMVTVDAMQQNGRCSELLTHGENWVRWDNRSKGWSSEESGYE